MKTVAYLQGDRRESGRVIVSTDRHGGVSHSPYHSLNLSYGVGDDPHCVAENRERLKKQGSFDYLLSARQVHGDDIFIAKEDLGEDLEVDGYDALMTNIVGVGLMIQQADCQAVTLYDPIQSAIAAVHCGWKGSVYDILGKTVRAMKAHYNTIPATLEAAISPSLGPCCAEFIHHAQELPSSFLAFQVRENYFDFWQISRMQLMQTGVAAQNIIISKCCTSCSLDHFSYRRACRHGNGKTGRNGTVIGLVKKRCVV